VPDFPESPCAAAEPISHHHLRAPAAWLVHEEAINQAKLQEGKWVPETGACNAPPDPTQVGGNVSPPKRPALPARAQAGGCVQPIQLTSMASLLRFRCSSKLPPHEQGRQTPPGICQAASVLIHQVSLPLFSPQNPSAERGHTSLLGALSPRGSRALHDCRHVEIGTI